MVDLALLLLSTVVPSELQDLQFRKSMSAAPRALTLELKKRSVFLWFASKRFAPELAYPFSIRNRVYAVGGLITLGLASITEEVEVETGGLVL